MSEARTPKDVPLEKWPVGWLKFEVASVSKRVEYLVMTDREKIEYGLPVTEEEMRNFLREWKK